MEMCWGTIVQNNFLSSNRENKSTVNVETSCAVMNVPTVNPILWQGGLSLHLLRINARRPSGRSKIQT